MKDVTWNIPSLRPHTSHDSHTINYCLLKGWGCCFVIRVKAILLWILSLCVLGNYCRLYKPWAMDVQTVHGSRFSMNIVDYNSMGVFINPCFYQAQPPRSFVYLSPALLLGLIYVTKECMLSLTNVWLGFCLFSLCSGSKTFDLFDQFIFQSNLLDTKHTCIGYRKNLSYLPCN